MAREQQVRRVKGRGERDRHGGDGRWIKRAGMWRGEGRGIRIRGNDTSCRGMIPTTSSTGLQPTEKGHPTLSLVAYRLKEGLLLVLLVSDAYIYGKGTASEKSQRERAPRKGHRAARGRGWQEFLVLVRGI